MICFSFYPQNKNYLANMVSLNQMRTTYPELKDVKIRLVPISSDLVVCEDEENAETCSPRYSTYHIDTQTIFIWKDMSPFVFKYWVIHEYGHMIDFTTMNKKQVEAWTELFYNNPNHVSRYSLVSPAESFAEWFAVYKYGMRDEQTYDGVESIFDSPQAKFMDQVYPKYRKPI